MLLKDIENIKLTNEFKSEAVSKFDEGRLEALKKYAQAKLSEEEFKSIIGKRSDQKSIMNIGKVSSWLKGKFKKQDSKDDSITRFFIYILSLKN